jgi:hypothetical protein
MPLSQENQLQMAIIAYKSQKIKLEAKAAAVFGVPKTTLYKQLNRIQLWSETHTNGHILTVLEEEAPTKHLLDIDK